MEIYQAPACTVSKCPRESQFDKENVHWGAVNCEQCDGKVDSHDEDGAGDNGGNGCNVVLRAPTPTPDDQPGARGTDIAQELFGR